MYVCMYVRMYVCMYVYLRALDLESKAKDLDELLPP